MIIKELPKTEVGDINLGNDEFISQKDFEEIYGDSYDYETLYNHEKTTLRWKNIFDGWKEKGYID